MNRLAIVVDGIVQGVGFRPFVYGLAQRFEIGGFVKNRAGSVLIEAEGTQDCLDGFVRSLSESPPPLAKIERIMWQAQEPRGERCFCIEASQDLEDISDRPIFISPDVATCDECLLDIFDRRNRRHLYPFTNCTNCGPRLTIVKVAPYDRHRTTMALFEMCEECRAEYENPADRRFHAQPICCPKCGPRLKVIDGKGGELSTDDPIEYLADALRAGRIAAIKGLGGYHLACDAGNESSVAELRRRKHRDEKPFAVLVADVAAAQSLCHVDPAEAELLRSSRRPIVLLRKGESEAGRLAPSIAPRNPWLGFMLAYTPVHHLLMRALDGLPLVMTSGNSSDEPIAYEDGDAIARLGNIADLFLIHDRPIHIRCDDSVTRIVDGSELPIRRSRGYAPQPIRLPIDCAVPTLAVGGQLKGTFALGHDHHAFVSHHMGDLDHYEAACAFERDVALYESLFDCRPRRIAHDLHPDYISTRYAGRRAASEGLELVPVQHHHAHMASCMAENGLNERVIGVSFDGTGFGLDGSVWGGEFLVGDYKTFRRGAHLRYVAMPGGERAIREPWRMAVAHMLDAQTGCASFERRVPSASIKLVQAMIAKRVNSPLTSSAGRLFDAVASIIGLRDQVSFEGQAAMQLEWEASAAQSDSTYPFELIMPTNPGADAIVIDTRPMIAAICKDADSEKSVGIISRQFHLSLAKMIACGCMSLRNEFGLEAVVLSGGAFMNALLTTEASALLKRRGFRVYRHRVVPPNDGGLSLGQLAVAAHQAVL